MLSQSSAESVNRCSTCLWVLAMAEGYSAGHAPGCGT